MNDRDHGGANRQPIAADDGNWIIGNLSREDVFSDISSHVDRFVSTEISSWSPSTRRLIASMGVSKRPVYSASSAAVSSSGVVSDA